MDFSKLIQRSQEFYHTDLLMLLVEFTALIIGMLYVRKDKTGRYFIFYIAFDFCILLADSYFEVSISISSEFKNSFLKITNTLIGLNELLIYYYFFGQILSGKRIKIVLTGLSILYLFIVIIYLTTKFSFITDRYSYVTYLVSSVEFILLLVPCILFLLDLFKNISTTSLSKRPSFWIVTGIFFFSLISIPYYFLINFFKVNKYEYRNLFDALFYYIPFTTNFVFLIKAFLCKKILTT